MPIIDLNGVNFNQVGIYTTTVTATDSSWNTETTTISIHAIPQEDVTDNPNTQTDKQNKLPQAGETQTHILVISILAAMFTILLAVIRKRKTTYTVSIGERKF